MSYHTYFDLTIEKNETSIEDSFIIKELRTSNTDAASAFDEEGCNSEASTWYSYEEDMKEFSKRYPEVLFSIYGAGDGQEDMWYRYFKDGKCQFCSAIITFDDFNESKLK
ncbi:MAG: hypothetical protein GY774_16625 [Planctomycetes bacterium]|nr:hypothetical protein [Planctomycetota bacterium]